VSANVRSSNRSHGRHLFEQGVGLHRIVHMEVEHGEGIALMKAIKKALDPKEIMNPGKIYP